MILAPSILAADWSDLRSVATQCRAGGARYIHVDVMDNHFVPNLTAGPVVVNGLRPVTELVLDIHLMVTNPGTLLKPFANAGTDNLTFHIEAESNPIGFVEKIHSEGLKAGVSLRPGTPVEKLWPVLPLVDLVLVMSVEPGFGGQEFMPAMLDRIRTIRERIGSGTNRPLISVDGGVKLGNAKEILLSGADILIVGSGIFHTPDPVETMRTFLNLQTQL
ncbi:MAG: ribulose-phosphate 3-epimerase [FCB group bacterium]|nr:ribulose-phosphate 3-epimerase [FCB group bacterium]